MQLFSEIAKLTTLTVLNLNRGTMQNVYAPLPLPLHIGFCVIATILYSVLFARRKHKHYFYLLLAIDLTILTQFFPEPFAVLIIAMAEIILLAMIFVSIYKTNSEKKKLQEARKAMETDDDDESERPLESPEDVIETAFDDDNLIK